MVVDRLAHMTKLLNNRLSEFSPRKKMIYRRGTEDAEWKFQKQKLCELCGSVVKFFSPSPVAAEPRWVSVVKYKLDAGSV